MKEFRKLWWLSLFVKLLISAVLPLSADEAYYWVWSKNLQLSYFDHPPLVSWLFSLGSFLEPFGHAVRWPAIILGHLTLILWYEALRTQFPWEKIKIWMALVLFSPLLGFGSIIVTPDLPVIFFWSLALVASLRALETKSLFSYATLGVSLGLGFCSKYHIVLFVPCLLIYLSMEKLWRQVRVGGVLLTILTGLIFSTPVLLWNYWNEFASFQFQLQHGLESNAYDPEWTISYLLGQIAIAFPLVLWAALSAPISKAMRWAIYFTWLPLLFFFGTSFKALVEANWPIIAYPSLFALALLHPKIKIWTRYYVALWGTAYVIVLGSLFIPPLRSLNEKISEPYEFQNLAVETQGFQPLYGSSYQMASSLWYFQKSPVYKLKDISRFDFFDTLPQAIPSSSPFYLVKRKTNGLPTWISQQQWTVREIKTIKPDFELLEITKQ